MMWNGRYLTLFPQKNGLRIKLTPEGLEKLLEMESRDDRVFFDLFEDFAGNGWSVLTAEQVGGLTGCEIIISPDAVFDENCNDERVLLSADPVYWHERYAIENPCDKLLTDDGLFLLMADEK